MVLNKARNLWKVEIVLRDLSGQKPDRQNRHKMKIEVSYV